MPHDPGGPPTTMPDKPDKPDKPDTPKPGDKPADPIGPPKDD